MPYQGRSIGWSSPEPTRADRRLPKTLRPPAAKSRDDYRLSSAARSLPGGVGANLLGSRDPVRSFVTEGPRLMPISPEILAGTCLDAAISAPLISSAGNLRNPR